jgi:predicted RNA methylase
MTDNTKTSSEHDFDWFNNNGIFMPMINDTGRNVAYKKAIEKIAPGSIMCDIGTGTGLLSILAAKAGAKKSTVLKWTTAGLKICKKHDRQLGLDDTIQVINKNFLRCDRGDIPDDVDYFVSETIGITDI